MNDDEEVEVTYEVTPEYEEVTIDGQVVRRRVHPIVPISVWELMGYRDQIQALAGAAYGQYDEREDRLFGLRQQPS